MLLRHLLDDLNNAYSIPQSMFVLDDLCIDKDGDDWNFAINVKGNIENSSIMLRQGTFVTDTYIHKNYDVLFGMKRQDPIVESIQRIELAMSISIEYNLN